MQTMFFNLDGTLLMAISVLDELSQKDGLSRVLGIRFDEFDQTAYQLKKPEYQGEGMSGPLR